MTYTTQAAGLTGLAHEIWALAQRAPGEGIEDCTARIETALRAALAAQAVPAKVKRLFSPMYLAPLDGTPVLLYMPTTTNKFAVGQWHGHIDSLSGSWGDDDGNYYVHEPVAFMALSHLEQYTASPATAEAKEELMWNGLTKAETEATASLLGLTPQPQAVQPVGYMSPLQLPRMADKDGGAGVGTWLFSTKRGNFTLPLYTAAPALTEEQEREAFEEWAESEDFDLSVNWGNQQYTDGATLLAWDAWKARAALRSTQGGE